MYIISHPTFRYNAPFQVLFRSWMRKTSYIKCIFSNLQHEGKERNTSKKRRKKKNYFKGIHNDFYQEVI